MPFDGANYDTLGKKMRLVLEDGKRWGKGAFHRQGKYCLARAMRKVVLGIAGNCPRRHIPVNYYGNWVLLSRAVKDIAGDRSIASFNDDLETTFADVARVLERMDQLEIEALAGEMTEAVR